MQDPINIEPIGIIRSPIKHLREAPKQGGEAQIERELILNENYRPALLGLQPGQKLVILYWLHHAERDRLQVHPRGDRSRPLKGVFATRSPHRPNPIALQVVELLKVDGMKLTVRGLDALDDTPLLDIKSNL